MWKQKIGISIGNNYSVPTTDIIDIVAKAGFDAISPEWKKGVDLKVITDHARSLGLEIQSLHAPFVKSADMWSSDEERSGAAKEELLSALRDCAALNIPVMVTHVWIGFDYTVTPTEDGFKNYGELVKAASELNVKIAFENTEGEEFLFALMDHFKGNEAVGFCWDSGHEMCYNHSADLLSKYGDVLLITHLNDNLGIKRFDGKTDWTDDLHLLPYDGIADWSYNVERLKGSRPLEFLNFELGLKSKPNRHENDVYTNMPLEIYFAEAYKRACRIANSYSK